MSRTIDHIVYTVADLDQAIDELEQKLGVRPIFGGYHPTQGTKNALVNLGQDQYLELLAIDYANFDVTPPRWMGVDVLTQDQVTRFALKSNDLESDSHILKKTHPAMGNIAGGSRNTTSGSLLQWELIMPLATPEVELVPFIIDWSKSEMHPSKFLPNMGCKLVELYGTHPHPEQFKTLFETLGYNLKIEKDVTISLKTILQTPKGEVVL